MTEVRVLLTLCWGWESGTPMRGGVWCQDKAEGMIPWDPRFTISCPPRDTFADLHRGTHAKRFQAPFLKTVPKCKQPKCSLTIKDCHSPSVRHCDSEIEHTLHKIIWVNCRTGLNTRNTKETQKCNKMPHRFF